MTSLPVLLIGSGLSALGALRLLHRAGIKAYCYGGKGIEAHSRWHRPAPAGEGQLGSVEQLAKYLADCPLKAAVLIPCSDAAARAIASLPPRLQQRFPSSTSALSALEQLCDKAEFANLLTELDLPRPFTLPVTTAKQLADVPERVFKSAFLKPRDSQRFCAQFGQKGFRVASLGEAVAKLAAPLDLGHAMVLQEYVPGPAANHMLIDGFRDRNGQISAMLARRRLRMYPLDFGNSSCMDSIAIEKVALPTAALTKILTHLDYRGIFSAEFKQDERDGQYKLLEINARVWWFVEFTGRCGVDVCTMSYLDALGARVTPVKTYKVGARFVHAYFDYCAGRALSRQGITSMPRHLASWWGAQHPHFTWTDPGPAWFDLLNKMPSPTRQLTAWMQRNEQH